MSETDDESTNTFGRLLAPFSTPLRRRNPNLRRTTLDSETLRADANAQRLSRLSEANQEDDLTDEVEWDPDCEEPSSEARSHESGETPSDGDPPAPRPQREPQGVFLHGHKLNLHERPQAISRPVRLVNWPKTQRNELENDVRITVCNKATGHVLAKSNKLATPRVSAEGGCELSDVHVLQNQLKELEEHMFSCDMLDVCEIVIPRNPSRSPDLDTLRFDLLNDYPKLTVDLVANSNAWCNTWVKDSHIEENVNWVFKLLCNNAEQTLWDKCLGEHNEFTPAEQGGPLMLCLILRRIQNVSDTAITQSKAELAKAKLSDIEGEDVDTLVTNVRSLLKTLKATSSDTQDSVGHDFPKTVLLVLQTSSVPEFNETFKDIMTRAATRADRIGGQPQWPPVEEILTLASNQCTRMRISDEWNVPKGAGSSAHVGTTQGTPSFWKCFDCGKFGHTIEACEEPLDQTRIDKARKEFLKQKKARSEKPRHETAKDGRPLILNRQGNCVIDKKKLESQEKTKNAVRQLVSAATKAAVAATSAPAPVTSPSDSATPATGSQPQANAATGSDSAQESDPLDSLTHDDDVQQALRQLGL